MNVIYFYVPSTLLYYQSQTDLIRHKHGILNWQISASITYSKCKWIGKLIYGIHRFNTLPDMPPFPWYIERFVRIGKNPCMLFNRFNTLPDLGPSILLTWHSCVSSDRSQHIDFFKILIFAGIQRKGTGEQKKTKI